VFVLSQKQFEVLLPYSGKVVNADWDATVATARIYIALQKPLFVAKRPGKLASHEVAGKAGWRLRPERTTETTAFSFVLSGQVPVSMIYQPRCGWLISWRRYATGESFLQNN